MRKKFVGIMLLLCFVSLTGCGGQENISTEQEDSIEVETTGDEQKNQDDVEAETIENEQIKQNSIADSYPVFGDDIFGYYHMPEGSEFEQEEVDEGISFMIGETAIGYSKGEYEINVEDGSIVIDNGDTYYDCKDVIEYCIEPYCTEYFFPFDVDILSTVMHTNDSGSYEISWDNALNGLGEQEISYNVPELYELESDWAEVEIPKQDVSLEYVYGVIYEAMQNKVNESDDECRMEMEKPSPIVIDGMKGYMFCGSMQYMDETQPNEYIAYLLEDAETQTVYFEEMNIGEDLSIEERENAKACFTSFHIH